MSMLELPWLFTSMVSLIFLVILPQEDGIGQKTTLDYFTYKYTCILLNENEYSLPRVTSGTEERFKLIQINLLYLYLF